MTATMTFTALSEDRPGAKVRAHWDSVWSDYRAWFRARGGDHGPSRQECEAALAGHMPELVPVHRDLVAMADGDDEVARFLSTWCPPPYLGGCSVAALPHEGRTHLIRNYDLSPDLNEGVLLKSAWTGTRVMGMTEFVWGLSDGVNDRGLSIALAFGGSDRVGQGFGICTILRYVLETCGDVYSALGVLERVPSHMDYNLVLADASGRTQSVEMQAGGGMILRDRPVATNHQLDQPLPAKAGFTRTVERLAKLGNLARARDADSAPEDAFLKAPLYQTNYAGGFGTLFTAVYDPKAGAMRLVWPDRKLAQSFDDFTETTLHIAYGETGGQTDIPLADLVAFVPGPKRDRARAWLNAAAEGRADWAAFGALFVPGDATAS